MSIYEHSQNAEREVPEAQLATPEWTPRRRELLKWFLDEAPSLAPAYEAAVRLLNMPTFPAREHLIGHIVRDIYDILPSILDRAYKRRPYGGAIRSYVDKVQSEWKTEDGPITVSDGSQTQQIQTADRAEIPWAAAQAVESLLQQHDDLKREDRPSEILARVLYAWYAEAGLERPHRLVKHFKDEHKWFMERTHFPNDEEKRHGDEGLEEHFASFEDALYSLVGQYFGGKKEIDDILGQKLPEEQIDALVPWLSAPHHSRYIFGKLENPLCVAPLRELGFFDNILEPRQVEGGGLQCRIWPQSRYLARMASHAPDEVADIFAGINTENWLVALDMIDAAKMMPVPQTAKLVPKICELTQRLHLWYKLHDIGEIVARLVAEGQTNTALELASSAFAVSRGEEARQRQQHDYSYFEGLSKSVIPSLIPARPVELLSLLVGWLRTAIDAEHHVFEDNDLSYMWRPAIEDHPQNREHEFASKLVSPVRDAFALAVRGEHLPLDEALHMLQREVYAIYKRLRLHLICEFAEQHPDLARRTMLDKELFRDYTAKHEYARLMGLRFDLLNDQEQADWYKWVDDGPEAIEPDFYDETTDDELREQQADYWKFSHLHWIREHLSGKRLEFYEQMFKEHGKPTLADLNIYSGEGGWGHETPYTADELADMGFEAAVNAVSQWRPDPDQSPMERPSREGLANAFEKFVKSDCENSSKEAGLLKGRPAVYVRSFLQAMEEAVRKGERIHLEAILDLCAWVVTRPTDERTVPADEEGALVDQDWQWCKDAVADLIQHVCNAKKDDKSPRFESKYGEKMLQILGSLVDGPTSSYFVQDDSEKDPRETDWGLLLLNSSRGKAMLAVFAYADWLATQLAGERDETRAFPGGFDKMPEVRDLLNAQLERSDDCFIARAAFGRRLGLLLWLDAEWLHAHADDIFNLTSIEQNLGEAYGWAAWGTFLSSNRPHIKFYELLRSQFSYAVDQASIVGELKKSREQPFARLAEHLMVLYGRGNFGDSSEEAWRADDGIIERLMTKTHDSVRTRAIEFVGMSFQDEVNNLGHEIIERFKGLWERYWAAVGEGDAKRNPASYIFGYWFASKAFDPRWSIEQLEKFVGAANKAQPDDIIMERLAEIAPQDPLRSARIVGCLVDGDEENWRIGTWKERAKTVLAVALKDGGQAKIVAEGVIDLLGRRGYVEFGDLLEEQKS